MQEKRWRGVWYTNWEGSGWLVWALLLLSRGAVMMGCWSQCSNPELGLGFPSGAPPELALAGPGPPGTTVLLSAPSWFVNQLLQKVGRKAWEVQRGGLAGWVLPSPLPPAAPHESVPIREALPKGWRAGSHPATLGDPPNSPKPTLLLSTASERIVLTLMDAWGGVSFCLGLGLPTHSRWVTGILAAPAV